jgi:hypothetical protein
MTMDIIDCGPASRITKGFFFGPFIEPANPPYGRCLAYLCNEQLTDDRNPLWKPLPEDHEPGKHDGKK